MKKEKTQGKEETNTDKCLNDVQCTCVCDPGARYAACAVGAVHDTVLGTIL